MLLTKHGKAFPKPRDSWREPQISRLQVTGWRASLNLKWKQIMDANGFSYAKCSSPLFRYFGIFLLSWSVLDFATSDLFAQTSPTPWKPVEDRIRSSIERKELPGAVVLVRYQGKTIYLRAFGNRVLEPDPIPMTEDTVFDLASLSKPIGTATAIWWLVEAGKIRIDDPVAKYLPAFRREETEAVTLRHLLLHTSGLPAGVPTKGFLKASRGETIDNLCATKLTQKPGEKFVYSDVGYILLGEIVAKVAGQPLDLFTTERIFGPLGMHETGYLLNRELRERAAPTEMREGLWRPGIVHDPRAYLLDRVAGHAGLFSTARDLARYAQMLLNEGRGATGFLLQPKTVAAMTEPHEVSTAKGKGFRTLGWDMLSPYSSNRGEHFTKGVSFGHTGFTGTSIWIDPPRRAALIFLSNRVHPDGKGNVTKLRGDVATLVAEILDQNKAK